MILRIRKYPDKILKKKAEEIKEITLEIKKLAQDMIETLQHVQGVGLAGPQIGESKRIIIINTEARFGQKFQAFINPEIIKKDRVDEVDEEGCLCFPGIFLKIKRAKKVGVKALNIEGKEVEIKAEGLLSRIFQHEIDHLNGKLIIDKIYFWQKWKLRKQLKE